MAGMASSTTGLDADWVRARPRGAGGGRGGPPGPPARAGGGGGGRGAAPGAPRRSRERVVETGETGEGGDQTLVIDAAAEDAVFAELERLHDDGARFTAVSEERGVVDFGDPDILVVIDPIDGSLNAKRGLTHHALSIAVAEGPTMADVVFGYVFDLGPGEEWRAVRGGGA